MFKKIKSLGKFPSQKKLQGALLELYSLSYALSVLPILLLSILLTPNWNPPIDIWIPYTGVGFLLIAIAIYLAERRLALEDYTQEAVQRTVHLAVVPTLPALFAVTVWNHPILLFSFLLTSICIFGLGILRVKAYSGLNQKKPAQTGSENF